MNNTIQSLRQSDAARGLCRAAADDLDRTYRALEDVFIEIGRAGANSDVCHPLRGTWERLRKLLRDAKRVA